MTPRYSLVEHLAKAVWFSRWQEGSFAVFNAYFDASGDETDTRTKFLSVGGFFAHANVWIEWEKRWLDCLTRYEIFGKDGLPEFHMSSCANRRFAFEDYPENKRQQLLVELADLLKMLGHKISCPIDIDKYKAQLDEDLRHQFDFEAAYIISGRACAARVGEFCRTQRSPPISHVQLFFERGDGERIQSLLVKRIREDGLPEPQLKPKRNRYVNGQKVEERLVPFQAADVHAWLTCQEVKCAGQDWRGEREKVRWVLDELSGIPEPLCNFTEMLPLFNMWMRACSHDLLGSNGND